MQALSVAFAVLGVPATARANPHAQVSLLTDTDQPRAGSTFLIGIRIIPEPGWHGYWSNPGDSGIAPSVRWKAAPGLHFGPLLHPAPTLLKVSGVTSYVHPGEHFLLARVRADAALERGTLLPIQAQLFWATCSASLCVPERTTLSLKLTVGDGNANASARGLRLAAQRLPRQLTPGVFRSRGGLVWMEVPRAAQVDPSRAMFFPMLNGILTAPTIRIHKKAGKTGNTEIVARLFGEAPSRISGTLSDGKSSYVLSFRKAK